MEEFEEKKGWRAAADAKWTPTSGKRGYSVIPNILFWYAADLGINPAQQATLFHLLSRWWTGDRTPEVSKARLAEGLGITERQVQRHLTALKKAGLIKAQYPNKPGRHPYEYSFEGLVEQVRKIAVAYEDEKKHRVWRRGKAVKSVSKKRRGNE
jgi:DNA-binding transcriptional ArsR family regulator